MINVCSQCLRLNPLANKKCYYCQKDCHLMEVSAYGNFRVSQLKKRPKEPREEAAEDFDCDYPDLRVFTDSYEKTTDFILVRP